MKGHTGKRNLNVISTVLPIDNQAAELFARIRAQLRREGGALPDFLIGATARRHELEVLTRTLRHFGRIPGLRIREA